VTLQSQDFLLCSWPWALHILSQGDSVVASHVISWAEINVIQKCLTLLKMFKMTRWSCCHSRCRAQMGPGYLPHETWKGPQNQNSSDVRINTFMLETSVPYIAPRDLFIWTGEPKIYPKSIRARDLATARKSALEDTSRAFGSISHITTSLAWFIFQHGWRWCLDSAGAASVHLIRFL
jgi:hypothetical protein